MGVHHKRKLNAMIMVMALQTLGITLQLQANMPYIFYVTMKTFLVVLILLKFCQILTTSQKKLRYMDLELNQTVSKHIYLPNSLLILGRPDLHH
ncbi:hypothetical protein NQ314_001473 [Rhamnusium bicolor]|uniref:Uncharacterized protein n=1 Tax=Rhamnusium bicolor TaxID=1586634 RepID=A0AAV8ZUG6_9CUCU|nr:hypothetical protein NQ314_001473 [Rhamnusium bicolor]